MRYKGYRILANGQFTRFYETDADGSIGEEVGGINYEDGNSDVWFSVIGKDNWVQQSFESVEECKQFIRQELA